MKFIVKKYYNNLSDNYRNLEEKLIFKTKEEAINWINEDIQLSKDDGLEIVDIDKPENIITDYDYEEDYYMKLETVYNDEIQYYIEKH